MFERIGDFGGETNKQKPIPHYKQNIQTHSQYSPPKAKMKQKNSTKQNKTKKKKKQELQPPTPPPPPPKETRIQTTTKTSKKKKKKKKSQMNTKHILSQPIFMFCMKAILQNNRNIYLM